MITIIILILLILILAYCYKIFTLKQSLDKKLTDEQIKLLNEMTS
jgi:hypothetical protein